MEPPSRPARTTTADSLGTGPGHATHGAGEALGTLHPVLVLCTQASVFAATCYVVAPAAGGPCLVLDPGVGVADGVARLVEAQGLRPVACAATHGHPDHVWDAAAVCDRWDVPFYLAGGDLDRLADPARALGRGMHEGFAALARSAWTPPQDARALPPDVLDLGEGLRLRLLPAPGHTPGSTFLVADGPLAAASVVPPLVSGRAAAVSAVVFTGDVVFAGSIGRMDLPGGDEATMAATLAQVLDTLPADALLLPGHGPSTTLARERAVNPYLGASRAPWQL